MYRQSDHTGLGYFTTAADHLWKIVISRGLQNSAIAATVSSFELAANISELYNLCLLKMDELISHANYSAKERQVKKNLEYFAKWRQVSLDLKAQKYDKWETAFIAMDTYNIMRLSFRGFFGYVECLTILVPNRNREHD